MPDVRQPQPPVQPALQLHDTMFITLSGAGVNSVLLILLRVVLHNYQKSQLHQFHT